MNRQTHWKIAGVVLLICGLQLAAAGAKAETFIPFDPPGPPASFGTRPTGIDQKGRITGNYIDSGSMFHGFLRDNEGNFITFDPIGSIGTFPTAINLGAITGNYQDANFMTHGFLRDKPGAITSFTLFGSNGTFPTAINPKGEITGFYSDANFVTHGFLRAGNGFFVTFDPLGAKYTRPNAINDNGAITGLYFDARNVTHGFVRKKSGKIKTVDFPNSTGTSGNAINNAGAITGSYFDATPLRKTHGFLRAIIAGVVNFTTFDPPGPPPSGNTRPTAITPMQGEVFNSSITGSYNDNTPQFVMHGFLRDGKGAFTTFDPPGSISTDPTAINDKGAITGSYTDNTPLSVTHGFLRSP